MKLRTLAVSIVLGALAAGPLAAGYNMKDKKAIDAALTGEWRTPEAKARDAERHPLDALVFWGLKPGMTILELQPGGGWWTEILAPFARMTNGEFYATAADSADPGMSENARKGRADFEAKYATPPPTAR